jgi:hypothetical protein
LLENKTPNERHSQNKKCETSDYDRTDDPTNKACLSLDLDKSAQKITKTDERGQTQKKSVHKNLSLTLFLKTQLSTGKKKRQT